MATGMGFWGPMTRGVEFTDSEPATPGVASGRVMLLHVGHHLLPYIAYLASLLQ
jgi:hypothetical protein